MKKEEQLWAEAKEEQQIRMESLYKMSIGEALDNQKSCEIELEMANRRLAELAAMTLQEYYDTEEMGKPKNDYSKRGLVPVIPHTEV